MVWGSVYTSFHNKVLCSLLLHLKHEREHTFRRLLDNGQKLTPGCLKLVGTSLIASCVLQASSAPATLLQTQNSDAELLPCNTNPSVTSLWSWCLEKSLTENTTLETAATAGAGSAVDDAKQEECTAQQV